MIVSALIHTDIEAMGHISSSSFLGFSLQTISFQAEKTFSMGLKKGELGGKNIRMNGPPSGNSSVTCLE